MDKEEKRTPKRLLTPTLLVKNLLKAFTPQDKPAGIIMKARNQGITAALGITDEAYGIDFNAEKPIPTIDTNYRESQQAAIQKARNVMQDALDRAIKRGLPYTNTTNFYQDEFGRNIKFINPTTKDKQPKISLPIGTSINILKIKNGLATVTVDGVSKAGRFVIPADTITYPPRYCAECGTRLTEENGNDLCDVCEGTARAKDKTEIQHNDRD